VEKIPDTRMNNLTDGIDVGPETLTPEMLRRL
jgi:hypothetical protein